MLPVEQPFKTYTDLDGKPLQNGYVYFGLPNQNPENPAQQVTVYWDADGTEPAMQPLRTRNGYIVNESNSPANVFYDGAYSELVKDSKGRQVFYARTSDEFSMASYIQEFIAGLAGNDGLSQIGYRAAAAGAQFMWANEKLGLSVDVYDYMTPNQRSNVITQRLGTMDVTGAIQKAINALGPAGGEVHLPPGIYLADSIAINGVSNVHLRGSKFSGSWTTSSLGTTIKAKSSANDVFSFSNYSYNCTVEGLHITGGKRALHFDRCLGWHVYNCNLRENATGIEAYGNGVGVIRDSMIRDNTTAGFYLAQSSGDTDICNCDVGNNKINAWIATGGVRIFGGSYFSSKYNGQGVGIKIDRTAPSADAVIRNVKVFGALIANNDNQIIIQGTSLGQRDIFDVEFNACHIHQADDGGAGFDPSFAYGYGAYVDSVGNGIKFINCDFIGCRDYAVKALNCLDGITIHGGSIRKGNGSGVIFNLVQWGRIDSVDFVGNAGVPVVLACSNAGDYTQNNRIQNNNWRDVNGLPYGPGGVVYTEDARTRANVIMHNLGAPMSAYVLSTTAPFSQLEHIAQGGNQETLSNQTFSISGSSYNGPRLIVGGMQIWDDGAGHLRVKSGTPTSATDGAPIPTV